MLKPFQIRDLHGPVPPPDSSHPPGCDSSQDSRPDGGSDTTELYKLDHGEGPEELSTSNTSYGTSRPGIIQMTAHEYDEAVTGYPQNSLMYMDDDDGETVTVGSSFELSQRLDEPIDSSASLPSLTGNHSPYQTISNPIHIFDIRRSRSTLDLWRGFEKRTVQSGIEGSSSPQSSVVETLPTNSPCSPGITNSHPDTDGSAWLATQIPQRDIQTDWLHACKPPRMSPKGSHTGSNIISSENSSVHKPGQMDDYLSTKGSPMAHSGVDSVKSPCSITEEGKRQAQEAGARFRNWKGAPTGDATSKPNPWSSYTKSQARLDDPPSQSLSQNEPEPKASPAAADEDEPLLAAFEAQMSKIMEEHATTVKSLNENSTDNTDRESSPTPSAPTEPFNSGSRPPPTPIDLLAQAVNNMVAGATRLSTDLNHQLPEIERHVSNASARIPGRVDGSLRTLGSHIQVLAKATQDASLATRRAAGRTRAADHHAIERAVAERLRVAAGDLNSIGSSIYSSLESSLGASRSNTRAESPAETPGQQAESVETAADSNPETSDSSVPAKEADSSCPRGMDQDETQQTKESPKPSVDSHHVSSDNLGPKPSTSRPTDPQQPLYETTPSDALPACGPGSTVEGTTKSTLGYPGMSTQAKPPAHEHDRANRRGRSRSPFSITQSHPPIPWDRRRSSFMPWSNPNPYAPRRYGGWPHLPHLPHLPHSRGSFPPSNIRRPDPTESRSDFKEPTTTPDTLFLGIPGSGVTEATIRNLLAEQGFLAKVHLPIDSKSGSHVGFSYLKFPSIYAARAAKEALQGAHLGGKAVNVEFSHGVNFDALQTGASGSDVLQPGSLAATMPTAPSALRRRPSLSLTNPDRNKNLKSKPSVTFADTDNTASATTNIKRYKSLGALPLASGGPFPYAKPTYPTSSNLLNKHHSLRKAGDVRNDDVEYVRSERDAGNKAEAHALLDQEDTDPEFSARYPSLLATRDLRRANTVTSATAQNSLPKPTTGLESGISRFPSLSQLEAQTFGRQHPKPTTTSAQHPPLSDRKPEARESDDLGKNLSLGSTASNKLPGSWPQETSETSKPDLLDQLHRVEGGNSAVKERRNILNRSNSLVSADPAARLSGPFNPDNERSWDGIGNFPKRSATERRPNRPWDHTIRPSKSYRGLGDGIAARDPMRQEPSWETYLGHPRNFPKVSPPQTNDVRPLNMNHPGMSQRTVPEQNVREHIVTSASESQDRSNRKIDACVEHLKALGFHNEGEDGEQRLKVYACAVDGNLGDAIEMIEEERKVYEQRPSLV